VPSKVLEKQTVKLDGHSVIYGLSTSSNHLISSGKQFKHAQQNYTSKVGADLVKH